MPPPFGEGASQPFFIASAKYLYKIRSMKTCRKCLNEKPESDFYRHSATKDGLQSWCKACSKTAVRAYNQTHPEKYKANTRRAKLKSKYAMLEEEFEQRLAAQGGVCAICKSPPAECKRLSQDHCHSTGKNRGILCNRCNLGLGFFRDDPELLEQAAAYLRYGV